MLRIFQKINYIIVFLFSNNLNEFKIYKTLNKSKNITIVDIGSNQGFFLKKINKVFKKNNKIFYSIEPNKQLLEKQNFKNVELKKFPIAISEINGQINFYEKEISSHSSLFETNFNQELGDIKVNKKNVPSKTIDKFINDENIKTIDVLKIDIEGYESKIIEDLHKATHFCYIKFIKIEVLFRDNLNNFDDNNWIKILTTLNLANFQLIGMNNVKYNKNKLFFFDAIFKNNNL